MTLMNAPDAASVENLLRRIDHLVYATPDRGAEPALIATFRTASGDIELR